jgi:acylphosphatase
MSGEDLVQKGYRITGRVHGVFFRAWTQQVAEGLGIRGTVRNRGDGSVEAHALGSREDLALFETRLGEGPSAARVEKVETLDSRESLPAAPFRILPTAP